MNKINLSIPTIEEKAKEYIISALESGWVTTQGEFNDLLTKELENYYQSNVLLTNSGTSALHLSLIVNEINAGDIVLCSNFSFAASVFPILYQNAIPVLIGIEENTWNLSPIFLKSAINKLKKENNKPKALVLTHSFGVSAEIELINDICKEEDIILIEDAAEALGSTFKNKPLGSIGKNGIISFNGNKIITASSGGALISNDKNQIMYSKKIANQSKEDTDFYLHNSLGYNYSISNILSAIGLAQWYSLDKKVKKRREIFDNYLQELNDNIIDYPQEIEFSKSNRWLSVFTFNKDINKLKEKLKENNIESRKVWNPFNNQNFFKNYKYFGDNLENKLFEKSLCLPSSESLVKNEIDIIIDIIKK